MRRLILRLSAALLTFALGVAITAIFSMNHAPTLDVANTEEQRIDITLAIPPVIASCYPGKATETATIGKTTYFPPRVLSENDWSDQSRANWYSKHLRAMGEEPLHSSDDGWLESYRFLWLRSFHHPVAVRIWRCGTVTFVSVKEMGGAGGYEPGKLIVNKTRELTTAEWDEFKQHLDESCYWNLSTQDKSLGGFDGAQWIFEAVKGGHYHIVDRWTPRDGSYRELCLYALKLSGLKVDTASQPLY